MCLSLLFQSLEDQTMISQKVNVFVRIFKFKLFDYQSLVDQISGSQSLENETSISTNKKSISWKWNLLMISNKRESSLRPLWLTGASYGKRSMLNFPPFVVKVASIILPSLLLAQVYKLFVKTCWTEKWCLEWRNHKVRKTIDNLFDITWSSWLGCGVWGVWGGWGGNIHGFSGGLSANECKYLNERDHKIMR